MKINMYSHPFQLTTGMENYIRKKLEKSLTKAPLLTEVTVTLSDINGTRGGEDKQCKLQFAIAGRGRFVIKDIKADMYHAIDSAAQRARHALSKANSRQRNVRHLRDGRAHKRFTLDKDIPEGQVSLD